MHHHTPLFSADHPALMVAIGALVCILSAAFVFSWQDSGDKLRSILREIDNDPTPRPDQGQGPARRMTARDSNDRPGQPAQTEFEP